MARRPKKNIFHIILTSRGRQLRDLYFTPSERKVNQRFLQMTKENEKVEFPVMYIIDGKMYEADYQLMIIKRKDEGDDDTTMLRDDYGRFVEYAISDEDWVLYDKVKWLIEETFWIYGMHPQTQRKTARWILDNIVMEGTDLKTPKNIYVFNNKLLVHGIDSLRMVICKNRQDCVRLYNWLDETKTGRRAKYAFFSGNACNPANKKRWLRRIRELTGWDDRKILRTSTRP